ncbi:response regulator [Paenibacillus glycanilyticus]|uniref:DNA-binding response regulator n=1 Tax=Paenibacillus glycanilyticus TaxID=126569 RepID=A0ABQ6GK30_9BACL|nr:response regulator [Paenibacillus glycanilyticus]GLX69397.1 DNA-binding response regulator [Paenibacillus glycanilyticus]
MNILIVDDEQHVREAIKLLIDWKQLGIKQIFEADNGDSAIELLGRIAPEIVITDMRMPNRDGVELLAWMKENGRKSKSIVISGYDDFHLVRSSMKYGGQDYLLKPIDPEQLMEALQKVKLSWEQEDHARKLDQQRNMEINQIKPVYRDKLFSTLISETAVSGNASVPADLREEFKLERVTASQVIILSTEMLEPQISRKFSGNRDLLTFCLINVANEILRHNNVGFAFRYWNSEHEIILLLWDRLAQWETILARITDGIEQTIHGRFHYGVGQAMPFPGGLSASYQAGRMALKQRNLLTGSSYIHSQESGRKAGVHSLSIASYEERFRLAVWSGKEKDLEAAVDSFLEAARMLPSVSLEQVELWRFEYEAMLSRWNQELAVKQVRDEPLEPPSGLPLSVLLDEEGKLSLELCRRELINGLTAYAALTGAGGNKEHSVMRDIAKYMEQHYNREVTLQDISERFYLSREYISRRFKQEMGENVFDYLGRIRVEKAKLLLQNPNLKIAQIAEMVGYDDDKYFSKVFKKFEGQSPNQYRKM